MLLAQFSVFFWAEFYTSSTVLLQHLPTVQKYGSWPETLNSTRAKLTGWENNQGGRVRSGSGLSQRSGGRRPGGRLQFYFRIWRSIRAPHWIWHLIRMFFGIWDRTANSFNLGISHLFSPFSLFYIFFLVSRPHEKTKLPLPYPFQGTLLPGVGSRTPTRGGWIGGLNSKSNNTREI